MISTKQEATIRHNLKQPDPKTLVAQTFKQYTRDLLNERDQLLSSLAEKQEEVEKLRGLLKHVNDAGQLVEGCNKCVEIRLLDQQISEPQEH